MVRSGGLDVDPAILVLLGSFATRPRIKNHRFVDKSRFFQYFRKAVNYSGNHLGMSIEVS